MRILLRSGKDPIGIKFNGGKVHMKVSGFSTKPLERQFLDQVNRGAGPPHRISYDESGGIGHIGLDVYEEEGDLFFEDLSYQAIRDDVFAKLLTSPNVLITGHQASFTGEAMLAIAETTIANVTTFQQTGRPLHEVTADAHVRQAEQMVRTA